MRRRPPFELWGVRLPGARPALRPQRLRRDPAWTLGVGHQTPRRQLRGRWTRKRLRRDGLSRGRASVRGLVPAADGRVLGDGRTRGLVLALRPGGRRLCGGLRRSDRARPCCPLRSRQVGQGPRSCSNVTADAKSWIRSLTLAISFTCCVYFSSVYPRPCDDPAPRSEDERGRKVPGFHVCERRMSEVYLDEVSQVGGFRSAMAPTGPQEPRSRRCLVLSDEDVPAAREPAGVGLDLPQLLERVYPDVRVRADGEMDFSLQDLLGRQEPVTEVPLRGRTGAHGGAMLGEEIHFPSARVRGVDNCGVRPEKASLREQFDRS